MTYAADKNQKAATLEITLEDLYSENMWSSVRLQVTQK